MKLRDNFLSHSWGFEVQEKWNDKRQRWWEGQNLYKCALDLSAYRLFGLEQTWLWSLSSQVIW